MKGFAPLFRKEMREQFKLYRLVIVCAIFLFFALSAPLTLKYLPDILKMAGEQNMIIQLPTPTAFMALSEFAGNIGQIGALIAVLMAMGGIANELKSGTAVMTLSKPVSRSAFVISKLLAVSITFLISMTAASLVCLGYTVWLIQGTAVWPFVGLNLLTRVVPDILPGGDAAIFQPVQKLAGGRRAGHRRDYRPGYHQRDSGHRQIHAGRAAELGD